MHSGNRDFRHAVVVGGSMAGLLCARVLSDHFDRVTILERDPRPERPEPRKGVPQARHVHAVLEAAMRGLEALFPGFIDELERDGAVHIDVGLDFAWHHYGAWKPRFRSGVETLLCTRPLLEQHVRLRVEALPNVEVRYGCVAEELLAEAGRERVTGVRLRGPEAGETLHADLVVDAAGRGTRAPRWLQALGYGEPEEERIGIGIAYTSRLYKRPARPRRDWRLIGVLARPPEGRRSGFVSEIEGERWIVSLFGYFGDHPPTDDEGFLAFARSLATPDVYEAIKDAEPLTPLAVYKMPESRWVHYERLPRFPEGFFVLGDSVCSLNPIYGQGMTVAVLCARLLGEHLAAKTNGAGDGQGSSRDFQEKLRAVVAGPWFLSTTMDLRYPQAEGRRPWGIRALQWALGNLLDMTSLNVEACQAFYEVMHMRRFASALLRPSILGPLLAYSLKSLVVPRSMRVNAGLMPSAKGREPTPRALVQRAPPCKIAR